MNHHYSYLRGWFVYKLCDTVAKCWKHSYVKIAWKFKVGAGAVEVEAVEAAAVALEEAVAQEAVEAVAQEAVEAVAQEAQEAQEAVAQEAQAEEVVQHLPSL